MLQRHVLDLDGQELAIFLHLIKDLTRGEGMHMHFHDGAFAEGHDRFSHLVQIVKDYLFVKSVEVDF